MAYIQLRIVSLLIETVITGPSYAVDTACSSSLFALNQAVSAMRTGQCDAAIVGGVNLLLKPTSSLQFHRLSMLSPQGMCKAFDASGMLFLIYDKRLLWIKFTFYFSKPFQNCLKYFLNQTFQREQFFPFNSSSY